MKKNNRVLRIGLLALVLTLVTASLVSGTFAKYVTTVSGTGTVTVAKWQAKFQNVSGGAETVNSATFDLIGTLGDNGVNGNLLAPGTEGSFILKYDTSTTQVDHQVVIKLAPTGATDISDLEYLKFSTDNGATWVNISALNGTGYVVSQKYEADKPAVDVEKTIKWKWAYEGNDDSKDTIDGINGKTYKIIATFTATQLD